ncbi:MAG: glycosyltransferase family 2 protein [Candidatus Margulisbacteria bacterium]|jgi:cellulose synthase/poly-beta-1,6-N-acetylglucosamine synthase-like glycosyltransferase|nr:glycosyltransferase family 2 protein [Candidatus Margulisiibacteriota bacterium]
MLTQNEFGLFTIGSMLYGVIILNYSTWATRMFIDMLTGISYLQKPEAVKPRLAENFLPHITVQIPCRNEPFELITSRSIQSALNLDYPQDKLTIMVVDNSEPGKYEQLAQYCQEHNILFVHREGKDGGKARNLNIGLGLKPMDDGQYYIPQSDLYFLTDADIEFPASILQDSLPEFQQNLRLPFIIFESDDYANENFFNSSLAAVNMVNNQGNVRIEQYGFTTSGGYGLFYNRHAWNTVGGWKEKFVGEDWATGVAIRTASEYFDKGKRLEYVKVIDRTPENLERLKIQQERWAKGGIETLSKLIPALIKAKHVPWNEKIDIVWRFSFYATMAYSSVMLPAVTVVIATLLPVNNISLLTPLIESWRVFIIPLVIAIAFRTIFWATRQNWKLAIKNITRVIPATIAYSGIGLAVMRGIIHGLYDKKKIFNITPKGQNLNENELLRIIQKNWKELLFGTTLLGTSLFLPIQLFFVGIAGICYLVSPFMSLLKTKEKKTPEN